MKRTILLATFSVVLFASAIAQTPITEGELIPRQIRKARPTFVKLNLGLGSTSFRDFATSPLIYKGAPLNVGLSRVRLDKKRESEIGTLYSFGNYTASVGEHSSSSSVKSLSLFYSQLYHIDKLSTEKINVKIGGLVNATGNLRINNSLQNNAGGLEMFPTLLGSIKATREVSRKTDKTKKFLFINYTREQRTRKLAYRLNVGLMNNSYRNGYLYIGQSSVLNDYKLFDDYQFNLFSGFRMSSALDYTIYLKNKNRVQLSYLWDAYRTGGDLDAFEMAHHTFSFSLLFNTNNR